MAGTQRRQINEKYGRKSLLQCFGNGKGQENSGWVLCVKKWGKIALKFGGIFVLKTGGKLLPILGENYFKKPIFLLCIFY
jgi:hypothetical protein